MRDVLSIFYKIYCKFFKIKLTCIRFAISFLLTPYLNEMRYSIPDSISPREVEKLYSELLAKYKVKDSEKPIEKIYYVIDGIYYEAQVGKPAPSSQEHVLSIIENTKNFIVFSYNHLARSIKENLIPKKRALSIEYFS